MRKTMENVTVRPVRMKDDDGNAVDAVQLCYGDTVIGHLNEECRPAEPFCDDFYNAPDPSYEPHLQLRDGEQMANGDAYRPALLHRLVELRLVVMLDAVPGAWHEASDFLGWACEHSYVQTAEVVGELPNIATVFAAFQAFQNESRVVALDPAAHTAAQEKLRAALGPLASHIDWRE